jgi:hypothetical protein
VFVTALALATRTILNKACNMFVLRFAKTVIKDHLTVGMVKNECGQ